MPLYYILLLVTYTEYYRKIVETNEVRILFFVFDNADHTFIELLGPMCIFMTARWTTKHLNLGCSLDLSRERTCMYHTDSVIGIKIPLIMSHEAQV